MGSSGGVSMCRYITAILITWNNMLHFSLPSLSCSSLSQCPGVPNKKYFCSVHIVGSKMKELDCENKQLYHFFPDTDAKPTVLSSS